MTSSLGRLLDPRSIAVVGGAAAEGVIRQCALLGYAGELWPVHPTREQVGGLKAYRSVADLPGVPDAAFIGVAAEATIDVVEQLSARGCGGAVCHASGFGETGELGRARQQRLRVAAGVMPVIGPNCMGVIDYVTGAALWPDQQGGGRVEGSGVAFVTQSGNIALNLTMQQRGLPVAAVFSMGNQAVTTLAEVIGAMVDSPRVSAVGVHMEQVPPLPELLPVAQRAAAAGKPVIVLRTGRSRQGARANATHTGSLAGDSAVAAAVLRRCGFAEVDDVSQLLEALVLAHVVPELPEASIVSASCSGGEAALVADVAEATGIAMPELSVADRDRIGEVLGDRVTVDNPLDYHTYAWGQEDTLRRLFDGVAQVDAALRILVLDEPRADRCDPAAWEATLSAWCSAAQAHTGPSAVLASIGESLSPVTAARLLEQGVAPLRGIREGLAAVCTVVAATQGRRAVLDRGTKAAHRPTQHSGAGLPTADGYAWLAAAGIPSPRRGVAAIEDAAQLAGSMRLPVVVKTAAALLHKSDVGGVALDLYTPEAVASAARAMAHLHPQVLVEEMAPVGVAEILVGVRKDEGHGTVVTVGAGGVTTELESDVVTLVGSLHGADVRDALSQLRLAPVLRGYRGRPAGDVDALVGAVLALASGLERSPDLAEVEVNPILVLPDGHGVVAVDVVLVAAPVSAAREPELIVESGDVVELADIAEPGGAVHV